MLTDTTIKNARSKEKPYKLTDEKGLHLYITPAGSRLWRCKYRVEGKEQLASFGAYPDVSPRLAREKRDELRRKIAEGKDPRAVELTFERLAREYISKHTAIRSPHYEDYSLRRLKDVFSELGSKPVEAIDAPSLLKVLRKIESRGAPSMAVRVRSLCSQIFLYGVSTGRCSRNIAADLKGALAPYVEGHHAAAGGISRRWQHTCSQPSRMAAQGAEGLSLTAASMAAFWLRLGLQHEEAQHEQRTSSVCCCASLGQVGRRSMRFSSVLSMPH
jgi:hypothetical protein